MSDSLEKQAAYLEASRVAHRALSEGFAALERSRRMYVEWQGVDDRPWVAEDYRRSSDMHWEEHLKQCALLDAIRKMPA